MTTHHRRSVAFQRWRAVSIAASACAAVALTGACRSGDERAGSAASQIGTPGTAPATKPAAPPASTSSGPASGARELAVNAKGQPWIRITARGQTLTVVTEGVSLVGRPRDDGKRKYTTAEGDAVVLEVKPRGSGEAEAGDVAVGFKLRGPDGKLLWKVKAGPTKIKVAAEEEGARAFVVSAKHPGEAMVSGPDGASIGRVRATAGTPELTGEDAAGAEVFRVSTDLPPAFFGALLFQGMPSRDRAVIVAELTARMTAR